MLKLEIKLDESKIESEHKYNVDDIYRVLEKSFFRHDILMIRKEDGTLVFCGKGNAKDYGAFGCIITQLKEKEWFMDNVIKWIWYNSDDGVDETDFSVEDVLYFYTKRTSAA
ncbi:hypothetical protein [Anaerostipes sp.]|uniref:hypothetical protein n=1 Tax=Anaerostipes sp. TaxID=1872530 RepID=UPI0025C493DC|nr:hypothetical protein [Anaerostipes sp.]MBS7009145.1 hypothetical protein [Anaerostipes sp.]